MPNRKPRGLLMLDVDYKHGAERHLVKVWISGLHSRIADAGDVMPVSSTSLPAGGPPFGEQKPRGKLPSVQSDKCFLIIFRIPGGEYIVGQAGHFQIATFNEKPRRLAGLPGIQRPVVLVCGTLYHKGRGRRAEQSRCTRVLRHRNNLVLDVGCPRFAAVTSA